MTYSVEKRSPFNYPTRTHDLHNWPTGVMRVQGVQVDAYRIEAPTLSVARTLAKRKCPWLFNCMFDQTVVIRVIYNG